MNVMKSSFESLDKNNPDEMGGDFDFFAEVKGETFLTTRDRIFRVSTLQILSKRCEIKFAINIVTT